MKKLTLIGGLLLSAIISRAQSDSLLRKKSWHYEFGAVIYNAQFKRADYFFEKEKDKYIHSFMNGAYLRFYNGRTGIRFKASYIQSFFDTRKQFFSYDPDFVTGQLSETKSVFFGVGAQRFFSDGILTPYLFSELFYRGTIDAGILYSRESVAEHKNEPFEIQSRTYGLNGGIGLRLRLGQYLTLSYETHLSSYYMWRENRKAPFGNGEKFGTTYFPAEFLIGVNF